MSAMHSNTRNKTINRFKAGEFNVLVATSIGEEGLDIGEIDLIACYDAQKAPVRMVRSIPLILLHDTQPTLSSNEWGELGENATAK